jgi:hypothetical protein
MRSIYSAWHLNLAFSSIEESEAGKLIDGCYWPLIELLDDPGVKFGIELSGWTLNRINEIDPHWVQKTIELINSGKIEILGSGWSQIISPLVPSFVTEQNLKFGNIAYSEILGTVPKVGFINEQCWSTSLVQNYLDAGYDDIVMEWENPYSNNPHWESDFEYRIQNTSFMGDSIGVIWNSSTAFQKMQKLTHGDITPKEWEKWFSEKASGVAEEAFCIYGGDAETFGYRANRFEGEGNAKPQEWDLVRSALKFSLESGSKFILPSELVANSALTTRQDLILNSVEMPIPTKKQPKYNPLRWAVGGKDANLANTRCFNIAKKLIASESSPDDWRNLLKLWGSDFRTHTTETKWIKWQSDSLAIEEKLSALYPSSKLNESTAEAQTFDLQISEVDHYLRVESFKLCLVLNKKRGLAIESLIFKDLGDKPIIGTTRHGEIENIDWNADFYTGELVVELPGEPKITDLVEGDPKIEKTPTGYVITVEIASKLGSIQKKISISNGQKPEVEINYTLDWKGIPASSLRFGDIVVLTEFFDAETLFLKTHNGGRQPEEFLLKGKRVEHGKHLSSLISSVNCFGVTEGYLEIGDRFRSFYIHVDQSISYVPALLTYIETARKNLFRLQFSARELDDTSANNIIKTLNAPREFSVRISKEKE